MKINHHILVLVFVCMVGGLALAAGLYRIHSGLNHEIQQRNAHLVADHHVIRLQEYLAQWLVWCDLIYGNGNTYLVGGAAEQGQQLQRIIEELRPHAQGITDLQSLDRFVAHNIQRLETLLSIEAEGRESHLYESLLALDEQSSAAIQTVTALRRGLTIQAASHQQDLTQKRFNTALYSIALCGLYLGVVGLMWRYTTIKMVRPVRALTRAATQARHQRKTLVLEQHGPYEICRLSETLSLFSSDLESRIRDLDSANRSLENEMTERRVAEDSLRVSEARFHGIFRNSNDAIIVIEIDSDAFVDANPQACTMLGYERDELLQVRPSTIHQKELPAFEAFCGQVLQHAHGQTDKLTCQTKGGARIPAEISASVFTSPDGKRCMLAIVRDITQRKQAEAEREAMHRQLREHAELLEEQRSQLEWEIKQRIDAQSQLQHDALHDALTDLPNRRFFRDRLEQSIARARRNDGYRFAVLFIDLDDFKVVNDGLGHDAGDELLVTSARRLVSSLRDLDTVGRVDKDSTARLGGDEFVILIDDLKNTDDVTKVVDRVQAVLTAPHQIAGQEVSVGASIGIAIYDGVGRADSESLLRDADTAMYRAKLAGKSQHALFDKAMHEEVASRLALENDLRRAIENQELELRYQPIVSLDTTTIASFEALVRWDRRGHGYVSPAKFIPLAEDLNLIATLGEWVLTQACRELTRLNALRPVGQHVQMSVNVSQDQLQKNRFVEDVLSVLEETGVEPSSLRLEITESMAMDDAESIAAVLRRLRAAGIQIAMDDFGTGYSSLSYLHKMPLDILKIDQAFIASMSDDREYTAIVNAIITLANHLGLKVVAEGIETGEQMAQMIALECDYGQGYLFSKPVTAREAEHLLNQQFTLRAPA